jgi:hypothetical protein
MYKLSDLRRHYLDQGFSSLGISTRTGAEILRNAKLGRVVKLTIAGKDPSVSFAKWITEHPTDSFPRVFSIKEADRIDQQQAHHWRPCAIEMEELQGLNSDERDAYERWIASYLEWRAGRVDQPEDSLRLMAALEAIHEEADNFGGAVGVEVRKPKNVMAREENGNRRLVILDPWY